MPVHMTLAKPAKGDAAKLRRARAALAKTIERAAKDSAKHRDGYRCRRCGRGVLPGSPWIEAAHITNSGSGGRPSVGCEPKHFVALCRNCHQGPRSVHSGHVRIQAGPRGGDGDVIFLYVDRPGAKA